jgi:hypothetical protein
MHANNVMLLHGLLRIPRRGCVHCLKRNAFLQVQCKTTQRRIDATAHARCVKREDCSCEPEQFKIVTGNGDTTAVVDLV